MCYSRAGDSFPRSFCLGWFMGWRFATPFEIFGRVDSSMHRMSQKNYDVLLDFFAVLV